MNALFGVAKVLLLQFPVRGEESTSGRQAGWVRVAQSGCQVQLLFAKPFVRIQDGKKERGSLKFTCVELYAWQLQDRSEKQMNIYRERLRLSVGLEILLCVVFRPHLYARETPQMSR